VDLLDFHEKPMKIVGKLSFYSEKYDENEINNSLTMKGFQLGTDLVKVAKLIKIPLNPEFDTLIVISDRITSIKLDDITLHLLGPIKKNVDRLQREWKKWSKEKTVESFAGFIQIFG